MKDLDKFKNEMNLSGQNVYVGHRYVPKIFGEWNNENAYEGLSIVTYQGASYTSRQPVPIGVDIFDEDYWVVTGNYNAQIEYYRQDVVDVKNDMQSLETEVSDTYVDTRLNTQGSLNERIEAELLYLNEKYINVKDFGAIGDGVTDDTLPIQNALDMRVPVFIPEGTFKISEPLQVYNDVYFNGKIVVEGADGTADKRALNVSEDKKEGLLRIINPIIDGGWDNVSELGEQSHLITMLGVSDVLILGGRLTNAYGDHIYMGGVIDLDYDAYYKRPCSNISIENVEMSYARRCNIAVTSNNGLVIRDNKLLLNAAYVGSIDLEPNGRDHVKNVLIENNEITNLNGRAILLHPHDDERIVDNVTINNNIIKTTQYGVSAAYEKLGIVNIQNNLIESERSCILINPYVEELNISNNILKKSDTATDTTKILQVGVASAVKLPSVTVKGNHFINKLGLSTTHVLFVNIDNLIFTENIVEKFTQSSNYPIGAVTLNNIKNTIVSNNIFKNNASWNLGFADETFENVVINGNMFIEPDLVTNDTYIKGAVRLNIATTINKLTVNGNLYSEDLAQKWRMPNPVNVELPTKVDNFDYNTFINPTIEPTIDPTV